MPVPVLEHGARIFALALTKRCVLNNLAHGWKLFNKSCATRRKLLPKNALIRRSVYTNDPLTPYSYQSFHSFWREEFKEFGNLHSRWTYHHKHGWIIRWMACKLLSCWGKERQSYNCSGMYRLQPCSGITICCRIAERSCEISRIAAQNIKFQT